MKVAKKLSCIGINKNAFFVLFGFIIFLLSQKTNLFWDPILFVSKMGNEIYYNSIFHWTIPYGFDSGHLTLLGFLFSIFWKILGYKLWISHLIISSFIIGLFYQLYNFINPYIQKGYFIILEFLMIIADPTLVKRTQNCLKFKAIDYLNKNTIEMENVPSFLSNSRALNYIDFKNDNRAFQEFNKKNEDVLYSNI
ncbi:MAG: hypothetical protein ACI9Z4_000467 [Polaribacter sp.]